MNLHGIVSGAIGTVNPQQLVTVQVNTGATMVAADGSRTSVYAPIQVLAQVQALTSTALEHADALGIQGVRQSIYLTGEVDGLVRAKSKGGDRITLADGSVWLVTDIPERYPEWTHCIVTLQTDSPS